MEKRSEESRIKETKTEKYKQESRRGKHNNNNNFIAIHF